MVLLLLKNYMTLTTLDWDNANPVYVEEDEYDGYDPNAVGSDTETIPAVPEPPVPSAESQPEDSGPTLNEDGLDDSFLDDWDWE